MLGLLDNILYEGLPYCLLALGLVLTLRYLRLIDLTFAASFVVGPAVTASLMVGGWGFLASALVGLAATLLLAGLSLGLTFLLDVDYLLASLLASFAGFAIALLFTQGTLSLHQVASPLGPLKLLDQDVWAHGIPLHPAQIILFAALLWAIKYLIDRYLDSEAGLAFRAIEDEKSAPILLSALGISINRLKAGGVLAGNLLSALAGLIVMLKDDQVTANRGFDALVLAIAAYLLGIALCERRALQQKPSSLLPRLISLAQRLRPTTAAIVGVLLYFSVLVAVSRLDIPSSVPKLMFVALVISVLATNRWPHIIASIQQSRGNVTLDATPGQPLRVTNVTVAYPGYPEPNVVLDGFSIDIARGRIIQLTGANGSGKSTLLKFLAGYVPGHGSFTVPFEAGKGHRRASRSQIVGYVTQDARLSTPGTLTEAEFRTLCRKGYCVSAARPWRRTAEELGVGDNGPADPIPIGMLSEGQRQYLNIKSFIDRNNSPEVVLFDEPLTHLDEAHAQRCVDVIELMLHEGKTIVIVQHDLNVGAKYHQSPARDKLASLVSEQIAINIAQARG